MTSKDQIIKTCRDYLFEEGSIEFAILFGSLAKNRFLHISDIDIGILTSQDIPLLNQGYYIAELETLLQRKVDLVLLNDLFKNNPPLSYEIACFGEILFCRDHKKYIDFKTRTFLSYFDTQFLRDQVEKKMRERIIAGK